MKTIHKMRCEIEDEAESAMNYAEKYLEYKNSKPNWATMYSEMAKQELTHADYLLTIAKEAMSGIAWIPEEDKEAFDKCQKRALEKSAMTKLMLSR